MESARQFFEGMFDKIWLGNHLEEFDRYYAKSFEESIFVADAKKEPKELKLTYEDIRKHAFGQKEKYKDKKLRVNDATWGDNNKLAVSFYLSQVLKATGEVEHRHACGIWTLNDQRQFEHVWAVVTPYYE